MTASATSLEFLARREPRAQERSHTMTSWGSQSVAPEHFKLEGKWFRRFEDPDMEEKYKADFASKRTENFVKAWALVTLVWIVNAARNYRDGMEADWPPWFVSTLVISSGIQCLGIQLLLFLHVANRCFPRFFFPEVTLLLCSLITILTCVTQNRRRMWNIAGITPNCENASSDVVLTAALMSVYPILNKAFNIRTRVSWLIPLWSWSLHLAFTLPSGMSPDSTMEVLVGSLFFGIIQYCVWSNQVSAELADRLSWAQVMSLSADLAKVKTIHSVNLEQKLREALTQALKMEDIETIARVSQRLEKNGWTSEDVKQLIARIRKTISEESGVCAAHLLSEQFTQLARSLTSSQDPTFYDMKGPFFSGPTAIGETQTCPRDGAKGCALVDTLDPSMRGECTHFLSWTWSYSMSLVQSAIKKWLRQASKDPRKVMFFMCFFVNNQYRILVDGGQAGSDNLEVVFESRLRRIGRVVALLDHWDQPAYLTRIWTIFEQYTASKLGLDVEIILPETQTISILGEIRQGEVGIRRVKQSLAKVDAEAATAFDPRDVQKVKALICSSDGGFIEVNTHVQRSMTVWIGKVVSQFMHDVVEAEIEPQMPIDKSIDLDELYIERRTQSQAYIAPGEYESSCKIGPTAEDSMGEIDLGEPYIDMLV